LYCWKRREGEMRWDEMRRGTGKEGTAKEGKRQGLVDQTKAVEDSQGARSSSMFLIAIITTSMDLCK